MIQKLKTLDELNFSDDVLLHCRNIVHLVGSPQQFWAYFIEKFGHYTPMPRYQDETSFTRCCEYLFLANFDKFNKLYDTILDYDILSPYNIQEEHLIGERHSNVSNSQTATSSNQNRDTSMDNLTSNPTTSSNSNATVSNTTSRGNDVADGFKSTILEHLSDSERRLSSRSGNIGNHSFSELVDKERKTANYVFYDIICQDILDITCLKIF